MQIGAINIPAIDCLQVKVKVTGVALLRMKLHIVTILCKLIAMVGAPIEIEFITNKTDNLGESNA